MTTEPLTYTTNTTWTEKLTLVEIVEVIHQVDPRRVFKVFIDAMNETPTDMREGYTAEELIAPYSNNEVAHLICTYVTDGCPFFTRAVVREFDRMQAEGAF
jgi:hypothetical protein